MLQPLTVPGPAAAAVPAKADAGPVLDFEKLDVHRVAMQFQVLVSDLAPKTERNLRDQLDRASVSIVLNIAEGSGRRSWPDKRRFYAMARGSVMECGAIVNLLTARELADASRCLAARKLIVRLAQMLTKLDQRLR
jgi:four helix bundle protein